jgi:hypothetical protein
MRSHHGSNDTPLDPPLFWLDNTFNWVTGALVFLPPLFQRGAQTVLSRLEKGKSEARLS